VTGRSAKLQSPRFISAIKRLLVAVGIALLLIAGTPSGAMAQIDATDVGTLDLKATSVCISVYSPFTGDDNGNNVAQ
jgi:hypothetical protein